MAAVRPSRVGDAALHRERTSLAWRRCAVSFIALGLATPKATWRPLDAWSLIPAAIVMGGATALLVVSRRRYERTHQRVEGLAAVLPDGRAPAVVTGLALICGAMAVCLIVVIAQRGPMTP